MDLRVSTPLLDDRFVFTILQTLQLKQGSAYEAPRQLVAPQASQSSPPPGTRVRFRVAPWSSAPMVGQPPTITNARRPA